MFKRAPANAKLALEIRQNRARHTAASDRRPLIHSSTRNEHMKFRTTLFTIAAAMLFSAVTAHADEYDDALAVFKGADSSKSYFAKSYGYALFPTVGKAGLVVGAGHGTGRVFEKGKYIGDTSISQLSIGFQAGGQAYSEIIFFQDKAALERFTAGNFELAATAQATAITAGVSATAGTTGASATASATKNDAATTGAYTDGMAVFTVAKGGLMYEASVAGQKFSYKPKK
jgi:lipid-binding SYLF domain-containing protein